MSIARVHHVKIYNWNFALILPESSCNRCRYRKIGLLEDTKDVASFFWLKNKNRHKVDNNMDPFLICMIRVCHAFLFVCSLVVTCWEKASLSALLCVPFLSLSHVVSRVRCGP